MYFSEAFALSYLEERYNCKVTSLTEKQPSGVKQAFRSLRMLGDYQLHGVIIRRIKKRKGYHKPPQFVEVLDAYEAECKENYYSLRGMRTRLQRLFFFVDYMNLRNVQNANEINAEIISDYLKTVCHNHEKSMASILTTLRVFLKFLYVNSYMIVDQSVNVPSSNKYYYPKIPSTWKKEDVVSLLKAVDRSNPVGKRDYAILLMVAKLGIRVGDLKALRLSNLNWKAQEITFYQEKTGVQLNLPILDDIGWAIIDYLKNGRAKQSTSTFLFIRASAPFECFGENANLHNLISKYTRLAGIKVTRDSRRGLHSLRHTLAGTLLEQGASLNDVRNVLGHLSTKSTSQYN
ncbi:MAG: site-specific integrase [Alkaliphilus sp.]